MQVNVNPELLIKGYMDENTALRHENMILKLKLQELLEQLESVEKKEETV